MGSEHILRVVSVFFSWEKKLERRHSIREKKIERKTLETKGWRNEGEETLATIWLDMLAKIWLKFG